MFLDKNDISILKEFLYKEQMQLRELIGLLNLKERSIKYKIDNINHVFHESGYDINLKFDQSTLTLMDKEKKILQFLESFKIENYSFSKRERIEILRFAYLVTLDGYKAGELESILNTGRAGLKSDLYELKRYFYYKDMGFSPAPKLGLFIKGNESDIRKMLIESILKYFDIENHEKLVLKDNMSIESRTIEYLAGKSLDYEIKNLFKLLKSVAKKLGKVISEEGYRILVIYLLVSIFRTKKFPLSEADISNENFLSNTKEYEIINEVIKKEKSITINKYEVLKLAEYLVGTYSYNVTYSFYDNWVKIETLVKEIIKNLEEETGLLIEDKQLEEKLAKYLRPAIYRMKNDIRDTAIDHTKVMKKYQYIYRATEKSLKSLEDFLGKKIDENEIAYLTVYLRMAIDNYRQTERKEISKNIIIVCMYGYGTSQLLKERIEYLYKVNEAKVLSYDNFLNYDLSSTQLIITSLDLKNKAGKMPIIKVSPLIDDNDMKKLDFYLERKTPVKIKTEKILDIINKYTPVERKPELMKELAEYCNDVEYDDEDRFSAFLPEEKPVKEQKE